MEHSLIDRDSRMTPVDGRNTPGVQSGKPHFPISYCGRHVPHPEFAGRLMSILSPVHRPGNPIDSAATKSCRYRQYFLPDVAHTNRGKFPFSCQSISDPALPFRMIGNGHSRPSTGYDALSRCLSTGTAWAFPGTTLLPFPSLPVVKVLFADPHILPGSRSCNNRPRPGRFPNSPPSTVHLPILRRTPGSLPAAHGHPSSGKYALRLFSALSYPYPNSMHETPFNIPPLWNRLKMPVPSKLSKVSEGITRNGARPVG